MKKLYVTLISVLVLLMLAGCGTGKDAVQEEYVRRASEPGMHEIYGISYPVRETYWMYSFNAEQLGSGEEWIDLGINCWPEEPELPSKCETKEMNGRTIYMYNVREETGGEVPMWTYCIVIPFNDEEKYIEIRADFVQKKDRKKTDKFYKSLMDGIAVTEDEGNVVRTDYISVDGIRIPAEGLRPSQFAYGVGGTEDPTDVISLQIDFSDEDYKKGMDQIFADLGADGDGSIVGSGPFETGGVKGSWYNWAEEWGPDGSDMMPYYTHNILVPVDELQTMAIFGYSFNGYVDDLSIYDAKIKELDGQIHAVSAE